MMIGGEVAVVNNRGSGGLGEGGAFAAQSGGGGGGGLNPGISLWDIGGGVLVGVV